MSVETLTPPAAPQARTAPTPTPAAPAAPVAPSAPSGAQAVKPAPSGTIPPPLRPFSERPESTMSAVRDRLRAKAANQPKPPEQKTPQAPQKEDEEAPDPELEKPPVADDDEELMGVAKKPTAPELEEKPKAEIPENPDATKDAKGGKVNPWHLVKEHKTRAETLEREIAELRRLVPNAEARKAEVQEVETLRNKIKELDSKIKFADYQSSDEYKETYEKPYEQQWHSSMRELRGITVDDGNGGERSVEPNDLLQLVNMPTPQARQAARELFGEFAEDVMAERNKIRTLNDARYEAINKVKTEGAAMQTEAQRKAAEQMEAMRGEVSQVYKTAVTTLASMPNMKEFLNPIDGDEEANTALTKGYSMVDEAFAKNPMDPSLNAQERARLVKIHAAVRHRAAAFGRARYLLDKERAAHQATKKKLEQYEKTVPQRMTSEPTSETSQGGSEMDRMKARLRARAVSPR